MHLSTPWGRMKDWEDVKYCELIALLQGHHEEHSYSHLQTLREAQALPKSGDYQIGWSTQVQGWHHYHCAQGWIQDYQVGLKCKVGPPFNTERTEQKCPCRTEAPSLDAQFEHTVTRLLHRTRRSHSWEQLLLHKCDLHIDKRNYLLHYGSEASSAREDVSYLESGHQGHAVEHQSNAPEVQHGSRESLKIHFRQVFSQGEGSWDTDGGSQESSEAA